ncbi:hypothetical protein BGZ63DRAFT_131267 [Mariannaea sp. PMI_226]|nr:hypothetical protein BGZ63DRAFT_131267 [Mariannaea sp. PMI_226]
MYEAENMKSHLWPPSTLTPVNLALSAVQASPWSFFFFFFFRRPPPPLPIDHPTNYKHARILARNQSQLCFVTCSSTHCKCLHHQVTNECSFISSANLLLTDDWLHACLLHTSTKHKAPKQMPIGYSHLVLLVWNLPLRIRAKPPVLTDCSWLPDKYRFH